MERHPDQRYLVFRTELDTGHGPNTISDTATFGVSNITTLTEAPGAISQSLGTFAFTPGASAYTINFARTLNPPPSMIGAGAMNDFEILQTFIILVSQEFRDENQNNNVIWFINSATAGILRQWTVKGSSYGAYRPAEWMFSDTARARWKVTDSSRSGPGRSPSAAIT